MFFVLKYIRILYYKEYTIQIFCKIEQHRPEGGAYPPNFLLTPTIKTI